jgi:hypothetical protein
MSNVPVSTFTSGSSANIATNSVTRDSTTEYMQLVNIGDYLTGQGVNVNSSGQLMVANQNYSSNLVTGTITTSTSSVSASTAGEPTVSFTVHGTYAGVNLAFEASDDGINFYPVSCARSDNTASETTSGVLTANLSRSWAANVIGFTSFRVRATAYTSGTANVRITTVAVSSEPNPLTVISSSDSTLTTTYSGTQAVTINSGTVNLGTSNGTNTVLYTNSTLAATTNSTTATMNYCAANTIFYTATAASTGTVTIYGSSDNTTFFALPTAYQIAQPASAYTTVLALPPCRYYRIQSSVALTALYLQFQGAY